MASHFLLMLVFSLCVSTVFAALLRDDTREQVAVGAKMFGAMVAAALILGWLMLPFPIQVSLTAHRSRFLSLWVPVIAYMAMIFVLSSFSTLPSPPGGLSDYHAHFIAYLGLAVVTARALGKGLRGVGWRAAIGAIVISTLYGLSDECHQLFVPGRTFDLLDLAADAIGSAAGACGASAWSIIRRRSQELRDVL